MKLSGETLGGSARVTAGRVWGSALVMCLVAWAGAAAPVLGQEEKPNVLFIAVDDLNDWITLFDPANPIPVPNLERLAAKGVSFRRAYCASPACNPSRVAVMTGLRPSTSGVYGNSTDWRRALPDAVTIPQHFRAHGYEVAGAGKIFHHHDDGAFHDDASFDDFQPMPWPPDDPMPAEKLNGPPDYGSANTDWGAWPEDESKHVDARTADYAVKFLGREHEKPWFLAVGFFRPHMPFFAPASWLEKFPAEEAVMPLRNDDDLADLPSGALALLKGKAWFWEGMMEAEAAQTGTWREAVRSYQASAAFMDAQLGRVLDALEGRDDEERCIVVLWSDHGYHLGEKNHWEKFALWEKTNHVPFIVAAPGVTRPGVVCEAPVDLSAIYPTLIDLCGLTPKPELDGLSLVPLLEDPDREWETPALMTYLQGNHAVRTERWRYIRYADGSEELYDHETDPHEWINLAERPEHEGLMESLRHWLPKSEAKPAPDKKRKIQKKAKVE